MSFISIFLIAVGLAMDAFAVSLAEGLSMKQLKKRNIFKIAIIFGGFQALMPYIGWKIGGVFSAKLLQYNYIIAATLVILVGSKMIYDGFKEKEIEKNNSCNTFKNLVILGIATSIDALAVGFSFSLVQNLNITYAIEIIGTITFIIVSTGVYMGHKLKRLISYKTEYIGGIILILIGLKSFVPVLLK